MTKFPVIPEPVTVTLLQDAAEIARTALGELPETRRAELLTDLLCELCGPTARTALCIARGRITGHLHDLIFAEYGAEAAEMGQDVPELVRPTTGFFDAEAARSVLSSQSLQVKDIAHLTDQIVKDDRGQGGPALSSRGCLALRDGEHCEHVARAVGLGAGNV